MSTVPYTNYFYGPAGGGIVSGKPNPALSVSLGADNGANATMATIFRSLHRHSTTVQAVANAASGNPRNVEFCGHGSPGMFETGAGQGLFSDATVVNLWNGYSWEEEFKKLWSPSRIFQGQTVYNQFFIWSCSTAGGRAGARLLQRIANITNRKVTAYTGLLTVGLGVGVKFELGHRHIAAVPGGSLAPLSARMPNIISPRIELKSIRRLLGWEVADLASVTIETTGGAAPQPREYDEEVAAGLYAGLLSKAPFVKSGITIPAALSHKMTFSYASGAKVSVRLFGGRLAEIDGDDKSYVAANWVPDFLDDLAQRT